MATFISQDKKLLDAYANDQDVYAIIASMVTGYDYEDCLEFYRPGTEVEVEGKKVISGTGKELQIEVDDIEGITTECYNLLETDHGDITVKDLQVGDKVKADDCWLTIKAKQVIDDKNIKLIFIKC